MSRFSTRPEPIAPAPGQESAWDYPRPPRIERVEATLTVVLAGETVAETTRGLRVLETSHPPNYYFPPDAIAPGALEATAARSFCEFKGRAHYFTVRAGDRTEVDAAWGYDRPSPAFADLAGHVAFYAGRIVRTSDPKGGAGHLSEGWPGAERGSHVMDACSVDGEPVTPQPGGFYGGWITSTVVGPFKGGPGSRGW